MKRRRELYAHNFKIYLCDGWSGTPVAEPTVRYGAQQRSTTELLTPKSPNGDNLTNLSNVHQLPNILVSMNGQFMGLHLVK